MKNIAWLGTAIVMLLVLVSPAVADSAIKDLSSAAYPGSSQAKGGALTSYAGPLVAEAAVAYYRAYERWPQDFKAIRAAQLIQAPLVGLHLEAIDPDNQSLDFAGDALYRYDAPSKKAIVRYMDATNKPQLIELGVPRTYREIIEKGSQVIGGTTAEQYLADDRLLRTLAMMHVINFGTTLFERLNRRHPNGWQELASSGLAGLDGRSVNPMTGAPISGSFGPNEIVYRFIARDPNGYHLGSAASSNDTSILDLRLCGTDGTPLKPWLTP